MLLRSSKFRSHTLKSSWEAGSESGIVQTMIKLQFLLRISKPRNTEHVLTHLQKKIYLKIWISEECVGSVNSLLEAERLFKTPYLKPKQSLCWGQEPMTWNRNFWWLMTKQKRMWKKGGGSIASILKNESKQNKMIDVFSRQFAKHFLLP